MYGDGNATKIVKDVMNSAGQIMDGVKESTGIDLNSLITGVVGGKIAAKAVKGAKETEKPSEDKTPVKSENTEE